MSQSDPAKARQGWQLNWLKSLWRSREQLPRVLARRVHKSLSRQGHVPSDAFECDFYGLKYHGRFDNNIDSAIYFYGAFEKPLLGFMREALRAIAADRGTFVDIGANVGQHSLGLSGVAAQVIAFEPWQPVRDRLVYHIKLNKLVNIQVVDAGLSDHNGNEVFFAPSGVNAGIGSFDPDSQSKGNQAAGELKLVRGDDYFAEHAPEHLHLIKMDVEGFEKPALEGLKNTLARYRPLLVCELTYGKRLSFQSIQELKACLPENYELLCFNKRRADGSKRQRANARARLTGDYDLVAYAGPLKSGQDDVVACPREYLQTIPMSHRS